MAEHTSILVLGSCRVFRPLRTIVGDGDFTLLNANRQWFTHTIAGARQSLEVLCGWRTMEPEEADLAFELVQGQYSDMTLDVPMIPAVTVVEVSSLRRLHVGDLELNVNRVWHAASDVGLEPGPASRGTEAFPEGHALERLDIEEHDYESLVVEIEKIARMVPDSKIVLVNHLKTKLPNGREVEARVRITEMLTQAASEEIAEFWDTGPLIDRYGEDVALQDNAHYNGDFEKVVGAELRKIL